jgi:type IV secretory pathway VirB10-like protein
MLLLMTLAAAGSAFSFAAQAQIKCWNDANGKRVCGDAPPAGAKVTTLNTPSGPSAPAPAPGAKDGAKAASKAPLTPAEREQEARKRQADSAKAAEKAAQAQQDADRKRDTCQRARAALAQYESGQRIAMTDAKGERYFMDDNQLAAEAAKARQVVQESCN